MQSIRERKEYQLPPQRGLQTAAVEDEGGHQGASGLLVQWQSSRQGFRLLKTNMKEGKDVNYENSRRGTGPRFLDDEGVTAKVRLIISRTDAIDPRGRPSRLLMSGSVSLSS